MFFGPSKKNLWEPLIEQIRRKLARSKGVTLSIAGKCLLVKIVLQSMHVYYVLIFEIPSYIYSIIDQICNRFLWIGMEEKRRIAQVNWAKVYKPKAWGRLGLRGLKQFNQAL